MNLALDQARACSRSMCQQLVRPGLGDDLSLVCALSDLLDHLKQSIGDGHAREALLLGVFRELNGHQVVRPRTDRG